MKQINPQEAQHSLQEEKYTIYLDVRTVPEFVNGHPPSALNIPVVLPDPSTGQMAPNADFMPTVKANLPKEAKIIVGCMSGGRSQLAAELMEQAGYQNIANMQGGFGGKRDAMGRVVVQGWRDTGLPIETGNAGSRSYDSLLKNIKSKPL
jgi:rhodanese-related sulfurtransferase